MSDEQKPTTGFVKLYHPSGALVTLPVATTPLDVPHFGAMFSNVTAMLAAGFTVNLPGLEAGEQKEEIGYVLRCEKVNKSGRMSSRVHLYSTNSAVEFKVLSEWLDSDEEDRAFEAASGLKLANMKAFPALAAPKRGESSASDGFIYKAPKPFYVIHTANPEYDEKEAEAFAARKETYKVPKRILVRWETGQPSKPSTVGTANQPATATATATPLARDPQTPAELASEYRFVHDDDAFARLEAIRERMWPTANRDEQIVMRGASVDCRKRLAESVPAEAF
jgi:hypothetical protein